MRMVTSHQTPLQDLGDAAFCALSQSEALLYLLYLFQDLYFSTVFVPLEQVDGRIEVDGMNGKSWATYLAKLQRKATFYVERVNLICKRGAEMRKSLDKPNIHRMLELYFHSIPKLGHVCQFQELVLEGGHQPLKKGILRSNYHKPHVHTMARFVADD